jgi:hypothetical protein
MLNTPTMFGDRETRRGNQDRLKRIWGNNIAVEDGGREKSLNQCVIESKH